jgi:hypothetical protein
MDAKD